MPTFKKYHVAKNFKTYEVKLEGKDSVEILIALKRDERNF